MMNPAAMSQDHLTLAETLPPVVTLLGGVPTATLLVMLAFRYVTSGTI